MDAATQQSPASLSPAARALGYAGLLPQTICIALILMGQVASGIFLSRRGLVCTTAAAIALLGGLTWAEAAGLLAGQPRFVVGWRTWMTQSMSLVGVAAMMYLNRTQMHMAQAMHLREATQRLKAEASAAAARASSKTATTKTASAGTA